MTQSLEDSITELTSFHFRLHKLGSIMSSQKCLLSLIHPLYVLSTILHTILSYPVLTSPVWVDFLSLGMLCAYHKLLHQPLSAITTVCYSHHCAGPTVCWISVNKGVLLEFHLLFELQSGSSHKRGYEVYRPFITKMDKKEGGKRIIKKHRAIQYKKD